MRFTQGLPHIWLMTLFRLLFFQVLQADAADSVEVEEEVGEEHEALLGDGAVLLDAEEQVAVVCVAVLTH